MLGILAGSPPQPLGGRASGTRPLHVLGEITLSRASLKQGLGSRNPWGLAQRRAQGQEGKAGRVPSLERAGSTGPPPLPQEQRAVTAPGRWGRAGVPRPAPFSTGSGSALSCFSGNGASGNPSEHVRSHTAGTRPRSGTSCQHPAAVSMLAPRPPRAAGGHSTSQEGTPGPSASGPAGQVAATHLLALPPGSLPPPHGHTPVRSGSSGGRPPSPLWSLHVPRWDRVWTEK